MTINFFYLKRDTKFNQGTSMKRGRPPEKSSVELIDEIN
jgi:hypothetical protein